MRFAVPFSFRRCGDGRGGGRDWGRGALFFLSPSVVDEGSESEQARRAREREREREAPEGRCTSNQTATRPQVSMTQSTRTTRRWGTERRRKRAGTPPLWRSRYGRTDGPSCSRRRASPFLRLTRDSSHHFFSSSLFFSLLVQVRQGFIRKVFSILAVQLLVTFSCAIGFASSAPLKAYVSQNMWPVYVAFPATFGKRHHPVPLSSFC